MNQVFDFKRWTLLVAKHWSENKRKYLLGTVAMAGFLFFWFGFVVVIDWGRPIPSFIQIQTYYVGLAITGLFFASSTFAELSSGPRAMNFLTFPASHLEKLLCSLLYSLVIFFVVYTAVFYLVDFSMVKLANSAAAARWQGGANVPSSEVVNIFSEFNKGSDPDEPNLFLLSILMYVIVQSAYILGSVYFSKYSFIKTTISLLVIAFALILFLAKVMDPMMPNGGYYQGLTSYQVVENGNFQNAKIVQLPEWIGNLLFSLVKFALAPLLWVVTYFRLKEKEV